MQHRQHCFLNYWCGVFHLLLLFLFTEDESFKSTQIAKEQ